MRRRRYEPEIGEEETQYHLQRLRDESLPIEERVESCLWLGNPWARRKVAPILIRLLNDAEPRIAEAAASSIGSSGSRNALPILLGILHHPHPSIRAGAVDGLCALENPGAVSSLLIIARDHAEELDTRIWVIRNLDDPWCKCPETFDTLTILLRDNEPRVRFHAANALWQAGEAAIPHLKQLLNDSTLVLEPDWCGEALEPAQTVAEEAGWAISRIEGCRVSRPNAENWEPLQSFTSVRYQEYGLFKGSYMDDEYKKIPRALEALRSQNVDALILQAGVDQFYLSGFEHGHANKRLLALVLRADGSLTWIAPAMNAAQLDWHGLGGGRLIGWSDADGYLPALKEVLSGARRVAFDEEARSAFLLDLLRAVPGVEVVPSGQVMTGLRSRKEFSELEKLRAAAKTVDDTVADAISFCKPGQTEAQIDAKLRAALLKRSPESAVAFTIVAAGENGAFPHHETGRSKVKEGDVVILDFGTRYQGYNSDITVTCAAGEPADPEARTVYRVVWEAQQRALEAIRPGVPCQEIDRAARGHISAAGYGDYFIHRTGHGLGLQLHEPPFMLEGNTQPLEEGMVFSVEPGIYLPGRFGVRLEVIASVGPDGVSLINQPRAQELPLVEW